MLETNVSLSADDNLSRHDLGYENAPIEDLCCVDTVECYDNSTLVSDDHDDPHHSVSLTMISDMFSKIANVGNRNIEKLQIIECYNRAVRNNTTEVSNNNSITTTTTLTTDQRSSIIQQKINEFVLINGETGIGKTTLARSSIYDIVIKDGGYYMSGKFDETSRPEPYSAFVSAITEFCKSVLSCGQPSEISNIQNDINNHIKTEHHVLTDMIPLLKQIIIPTTNNERTNVSSTLFMDDNGSNAIHRFKYMFRMLMKAIQSMDRPIVFFLDDLHWADESSLDLLLSLLLDAGGCNNRTSTGILFMATYRIEEQSIRFQKFLDNIHCDSIHLSIINLGRLSSNDVHKMLTEAMNLDIEVLKPLSDQIHHHTNGNICFVFEYLRFLTLRKLLLFEESTKKWKWNIDDVRVAITKLSLDDFILFSIQDMSESTQHFVKCAACLGTKLDLNILNHVVSDPINVHIEALESNGLIKFDTVDECWKFTHDVIKEAVCRRLTQLDNRNEFHYHIGKRLWLQLSLEEIDRYIFVVVGQLLFGNDDFITKQEERNAIAKLCFRAGERSVELSHFHNAFDYLSIGISFLDKKSCWRNKDEYDFCLKLYNATSEVAYCIGNYDVVNELVNEILSNARIFNDTIQAYCTKIFVLGSTGQLQDAVDTGLMILKKLDESIPIRFTIMHILLEARRLKKITNKMNDQDYLQLPRMHNQQKLLAMKVFNAIFSYSYMICPELFLHLGLRLFHLSLEYGQNVMTPAGFVLYGIYLAGAENVESGYRFGCLGMKIFEQYNIQQWTGRVYSIFYGFLYDLKMPMKDAIEPLRHAYTISLEKGDVEYGFLCGNLILYSQLQLVPLDKLYNEIQSHIRQLNIFGQFHTLEMVKALNVTIRNLLWNANPDIHCPCNKFIDENECNNNQSPSEAVLGWDLVLQMWLCYLFGHYDKAYEHAQVIISSSVVNKGSRSSLPFALLFIGLTNIEYAHRHDNCKLTYAKKCLKQIKEYARNAPSNSLGKKFLLEAELISFEGKKNKQQHVKAFEKYTAAIALSKDSGFLMETALGYERAAKELVRVGDYTRASTYFNEAITFYSQWGSHPKVKHLLQEIENYEKIHQQNASFLPLK